MKQIKQEAGRSMVEMLGVLAVIGVLSVGGIAGYTIAMNKHRANSVVGDLMKRAVIISSQRQLNQPANMNDFGDKVGEYPINNDVDTNDTNKTFSMTVEAVPQEVCEKILALDWQNATITPDKAEDCNGGNMIFTFNNDLSPVTSSNAGGEGTNTPQEPKECSECNSECGVCDTLTGKCVPNNNLCPLDKPYCGANGICTECDNGLWNSVWNSCGECSSAAGFPNYTQTDCHVCDNRYLTTSGACVYCEVPFAENFVEDKSECLERCPNYNVFSTKTWNTALTAGAVGGCYYCNPQYSVPSENRDECIQVNSCPEGQYFGFGSCSTCDEEKVAQNKTSKEQCERCKGLRYFSVTGNRCVGKSLEYDSVNKRNWAGVEKEYCLAMKNAPLFFYGTDEKSGICEWCPTEIETNGNGEKVCADTCPTGTYLYLEHKQGGKNSCCPNNATCAGRKTKCNAGYYLNADGTACDAA